MVTPLFSRRRSAGARRELARHGYFKGRSQHTHGVADALHLEALLDADDDLAARPGSGLEPLQLELCRFRHAQRAETEHVLPAPVVYDDDVQRVDLVGGSIVEVLHAEIDDDHLEALLG